MPVMLLISKAMPANIPIVFLLLPVFCRRIAGGSSNSGSDAEDSLNESFRLVGFSLPASRAADDTQKW